MYICRSREIQVHKRYIVWAEAFELLEPLSLSSLDSKTFLRYINIVEYKHLGSLTVTIVHERFKH